MSQTFRPSADLRYGLVCLGPRRYVIARLDAFRVLHFVWPAWDFLDMYHKSDTFCMVFHTLAGSRGGGGGGVLGWGGVISAAPRDHVYRGGGGRGGGLGVGWSHKRRATQCEGKDSADSRCGFLCPCTLS